MLNFRGRERGSSGQMQAGSSGVSWPQLNLISLTPLHLCVLEGKGPGYSACNYFLGDPSLFGGHSFLLKNNCSRLSHPIVVVQLPTHVQLFAIPWTPACQASLSITISRSLPKFMSTDAIQPSHPLSSPSHPAFSLSQHQCLFQ